MMNFGAALEVLKAGGLVTRALWEGKWIYIDREVIYFSRDGGSEGVFIPSSKDLLAEDWNTTGVKNHDERQSSGNGKVPQEATSS